MLITTTYPCGCTRTVDRGHTVDVVRDVHYCRQHAPNADVMPQPAQPYGALDTLAETRPCAFHGCAEYSTALVKLGRFDFAYVCGAHARVLGQG